MANLKRPGGEMSARPLHFVWIVDCSGTMAGDKIQQVNHVIRECLPAMRAGAEDHANVQMLIRVIRFASGAQWLVSQPTPIDRFEWQDLTAGGETDMGAALKLVAGALKKETIGERGLPPVLVLLTDGQPTDDFGDGLRTLMAEPWAQKSVRIAIAIGDDAVIEPLQRFIGNSERKPLVVKNATELATAIRWATTVVPQSAAKPASQFKGATDASNVPLPIPPQTGSGVTDKAW